MCLCAISSRKRLDFLYYCAIINAEVNQLRDYIMKFQDIKIGQVLYTNYSDRVADYYTNRTWVVVKKQENIASETVYVVEVDKDLNRVKDFVTCAAFDIEENERDDKFTFNVKRGVNCAEIKGERYVFDLFVDAYERGQEETINNFLKTNNQVKFAIN